jgi:hypothetical protein
LSKRGNQLIFLTTSAIEHNISAVKENSPEVWRQIRRFNLPVQLALAAAHKVMAYATEPSQVALISIAPCQNGSPAIFRLGHAFIDRIENKKNDEFRINPTYSLHVVDNLALSSLSIAFKNHAYCLGLGGAPGQVWAGLEVVQEVLASGRATEALLMAGDQDSSENLTESGTGVAALFTKHKTPYENSDKSIQFKNLDRTETDEFIAVKPHSADGLAAFLEEIVNRTQKKRFLYSVPHQQTDGHNNISIDLELR